MDALDEGYVVWMINRKPTKEGGLQDDRLQSVHLLLGAMLGRKWEDLSVKQLVRVLMTAKSTHVFSHELKILSPQGSEIAIGSNGSPRVKEPEKGRCKTSQNLASKASDISTMHCEEVMDWAVVVRKAVEENDREGEEEAHDVGTLPLLPGGRHTGDVRSRGDEDTSVCVPSSKIATCLRPIQSLDGSVEKLDINASSNSRGFVRILRESDEGATRSVQTAGQDRRRKLACECVGSATVVYLRLVLQNNAPQC